MVRLAELGTWLHVRRGRPQFSRTGQALQPREIDKLAGFGIPDEFLRYLTPETFRAATTFGKGALDAESDEVNSLMHPVLLRLYLEESWLR